MHNPYSYNKKEVTRIDKNQEEITIYIYLTYYNSSIAQDLWKAHYQSCQ